MYPPVKTILASTFERVDDRGNLSRIANNQSDLNFTELQFDNLYNPDHNRNLVVDRNYIIWKTDFPHTFQLIPANFVTVNHTYRSYISDYRFS